MNDLSAIELVIAAAVAFSSTFSGVSLAYLLSVRRERANRVRDDERRRTLVGESILQELQTSLRTVNRYLESNPDYVAGGGLSMISLSTDALDAAVSSGGFALLEVPLQGNLSHTYRSLRTALDDSRRLQDANTSVASGITSTTDVLSYLQMELNNDVVRLQTLISESISALEALTDGESLTQET